MRGFQLVKMFGEEKRITRRRANQADVTNHTDDFDKARYYSKPFTMRGKEYFLCSQWFETPANNDRPFY